MDEIQASMDELITELAEAAPDEEIVRNFATIGAVYEDGVSLIFDGETEPTEKHYLCNTNVYFSPGDRVRILADAGTYIVEYVVGPPRQTQLHGIPSGGASAAFLKKRSADDYDAFWSKTVNATSVNGVYFQISNGIPYISGNNSTWYRIALA